MSTVQLVLESMDLDPLARIGNLDPFDMFKEDGHTFLEEALHEASTGATKGNMVQKLWAFIKKVCAWIGRQLSRLWNFVKSIFKRNTKSADQIASEVLASTSNNPSTGGSSSNNPLSIHFPSLNLSPEDSGKSDKGDSVKAKSSPIPSAKESTVEPPNFDAIIKPLACAFDKDKETVVFTYEDTMGDAKAKVTVPEKGRVRMSDIDEVFCIIRNADILSDFIECVNILKTRELNNNNFHSKYQDFVHKYNAAHDVAAKVPKDIFVFTLKEIDEFNKKFMEICKIVETIDIPEYVDKAGIGMGVGHKFPYDSTKVAADMNDIGGLIARWQMGLNHIMGAMQSVYQIDRRFFHTINDIETLSLFTQKMMESGIPGKYIMWNTYKICTEEFCGSNSSERDPIWGQSRFVLFPDNDKNVVHKVAYNPNGVRANKSEIMISNKVKELGESDLVSPVTKQSKNQYVIDMQRTGNQEPNSDTAKVLRDKLNNFLNDNKLPVNIFDVHTGNVRPLNGKWVIIDYGAVERSTT